MIEVVIQMCPRGTLLSKVGLAEYGRRNGAEVTDAATIARDDPQLVAMMKEDVGKRAWAGECSRINIVGLPDGFKWKIVTNARDAREWIAGA